MWKRNAAVAIVAVLVLGVGAYAWAQGGPDRPSTSTTAQAGADGGNGAQPGARPGRRGGHRGVLRRIVHGDLVVRGQNGFENVTYDRGTVTDVTGSSITIKRPDNQTVTKHIDQNTKFRGVQSASEVQKDKPAVVVAKGDNATIVGQRTANGQGTRARSASDDLSDS